jgi:hypothetical protein
VILPVPDSPVAGGGFTPDGGGVTPGDGGGGVTFGTTVNQPPGQFLMYG